jgi:two-component system, OmpR family, response regulator ChvI
MYWIIGIFNTHLLAKTRSHRKEDWKMEITTDASSVNGDKNDALQGNNPGYLPAQVYDEICFIGIQSCCVCFVDIVDSTRITSNLDNPEKIRKYYSIFLNSMAAIARGAGAKIIKNIGDSLVFYYPVSSESFGISVFYNVLECCMTMIGARNSINRKLQEEGLPPVSYRISADYGRVEVAKSATSIENDIFGTIINRCSRINLMAIHNGIAIGNGLYEAIKSSLLHHTNTMNYDFEEIIMPQHDIGEFTNYPIYHVHRNNNFSSFSQLDTPGSQLAPINVLLVDDEEDSLWTFKECLSSGGYNTDAFTDPLKALDHVASQSPSHYRLVILDIRMPGLNGLQLYHRLKAINRNIKILFVSALEDVPELTSILPDTKTKDSFVKKPVTIESFMSTVRATLSSQR